MRRIDFLFALLLTFSCAVHASEEGHHGSAETAHGDLAPKAARQSSRDVKIPLALLVRLEKEYREYLEKNKLPPQEILKRGLLDVSVELRQSRPAALQENSRIATPLGGGVVDLADFVTPLRGSFRSRIEARDSHGPVIGKVFYISHARVRRIDGEDWAAGCGKFMEITDYFNAKMAGEGFDLYTAGQRYLSVLAGTFMIVVYSTEALQVASVTFTDSRFPEIMCE